MGLVTNARQPAMFDAYDALLMRGIRIRRHRRLAAGLAVVCNVIPGIFAAAISPAPGARYVQVVTTPSARCARTACERRAMVERSQDLAGLVASPPDAAPAHGEHRQQTNRRGHVATAIPAAGRADGDRLRSLFGPVLAVSNVRLRRLWPGSSSTGFTAAR